MTRGREGRREGRRGLARAARRSRRTTPHAEQLDDVASTLIEPLVLAAGRGASVACSSPQPSPTGDPSLPDDARGPRSRAFRERALARDPTLWRAHLMSILDDAAQHGLAEAVEPLRKLAADVPGEPEMLEELAQLYGKLRVARRTSSAPWRTWRRASPTTSSRCRPTSARSTKRARRPRPTRSPRASRSSTPTPRSTSTGTLARRDYKAAIAELHALEKRRPDQQGDRGPHRRRAGPLRRPARRRRGDREGAREAPARRQGPLRAGRPRVTPAATRTPCTRALATALQTGANTAELRTAIDLRRGRDRPRAVPQGRPRDRPRVPGLGGGGAPHGGDGRPRPRLRRDVGSRRRVERDARARDPEDPVAGGHQRRSPRQEPPQGLVLHLRVIKPDGRVLEPEPVAGKPTLTLPHLEVGDFVEMEHITGEPGDGAKGRQYASPTLVLPRGGQGLLAQRVHHGHSRRPRRSRSRRAATSRPRRRGRSGRSSSDAGAWTSARPRRWSPTARPSRSSCRACASAGASRSRATLAHLVDLAPDETPLDPRLRARALDLVQGVPVKSSDERARSVCTAGRWSTCRTARRPTGGA